MPVPHAVTRHKVYRNLKAKLGKDNDWKDIAKQLVIVHPRFNKGSTILPEAFVFDGSPQGHAYWVNICKRAG